MNAINGTILPATTYSAPNRGEVEDLIDRLKHLQARAAVRSEARRALLDRRGQMSARARLAALLDADAPYLELYNMASYLVDDPDPESSVPGASLLAGVGFVSGVRCVVCVDDAGINAGALRAKTVDKLLGVIAVATQQKLPFVHLMDSIGADLMRYDAGQWGQAGSIFTALGKLTAQDIPIVTVLHGTAIGANAMLPGLSDAVIAVRGQATAMMAGAAQVRATTGEVARDEALGGVELHAEVTGLVDVLARDDAEAIKRTRDVIAGLDWAPVLTQLRSTAPIVSDMLAASGQRGDVLDVITSRPDGPWDIKELIAVLVDHGEFRPFKPGYGPASLCLNARLSGHPVAIVAHNGLIDPDGARKIMQFLQRSEATTTPIIFLHNTRGFATGRQAERGGIVQLAARLVRRMAGLKVPKISLKVGESFGAASYALGGGAGGSDFLFTWPNATTGVMNSADAAQTMDQVARRSARRRGLAVDEGRLSGQRERLRAKVAGQSDAFVTSGQCLDMGMIDPRDSRRVLSLCLDICAESAVRGQPRKRGCLHGC